MPKRQSNDSNPQDPQALRPAKRVRKASATQDSINGLDSNLPDLADDKLVMTISPALLSGDTSKPGGGIRRRMNPESLAGRLGPELVKELEALLKGGMTEMPPFAVRQEIQQRYGIDRRHIYDWFHNKGLRVASSEQREERRAAKARAAESGNSDKRSLRNSHAPDGHGNRDRPDGAGNSCEHELTEESMPPSSPTMPMPLLPDGTAPCEAGQQDPDVFPPVDDYSDEPSFASPCVFGLPPPVLLGDARACSPLLPELMSPRLPSAEGIHQVPTERTSLWIAEQQRIAHSDVLATPPPTCNRPRVVQVGSSPYTAPPPDSQPILSQPVREALYQSLIDVLPPARGIEESVGTYKAFMTQQVQTYYEKLTSNGRHPSSGSLAASTGVVPQATALPPDSSVSSAPVHAATKIEYQSPLLYPPPEAFHPTRPTGVPIEFSNPNWLLYAGHQHPGAPGAAPSPSCTPALSETATTATSSGYWLPDPFQTHARERTAASCMRLNELLESPVLRSRNPTQDSPAYGQIQMQSPHIPHAYMNVNIKHEPAPTIHHGPPFGANVSVFPAYLPVAPSATPDFVHEYAHVLTHGITSTSAPASRMPAAVAVSRTDHVAVPVPNSTIFIADSRSSSENVHVNMHAPQAVNPGGTLPIAASAPVPIPKSKAAPKTKTKPAPKATKAKTQGTGAGRPRGRPPGQKNNANNAGRSK
ncbi:hypothetical protein EIP86_005477 [Pleurotus ostreatoroseus]|nr:hypothetical protein EIP86_005477 [Pleurotus ostreatoroseus]